MSTIINIRSCDLLELISASLNADYTGVRRAANQLAAFVAQPNQDVAKQIKAAVRRNGVPLRASGYSTSLPVDPKSRSPLIEEHPWPVTPAFLEENTQNVFEAFIRDAENLEKLQAHGLSGRMNMLMSGPPGTGKSLIAGHIAAKLNKPFYVVRLDSLVSSLLGDTAKNIRSVFDYVASSNGVLFLDEFDAIAKVRDDQNELGELKRVVNTLIQNIDALDDKAILIAATNHADLLDSAIWRRFPYKMQFHVPNKDLRKHLWGHFLFQDDFDDTLVTTLSKISQNLSGAEIETLAISARRQAILCDSEIDTTAIALAVYGIQEGSKTSSLQTRLTQQERKKLALNLMEKFKLNASETAKLLKASRQTISTYLKE